MSLKGQRSFRRIFIKVTAVVLAIFVSVVACLYIWFVNNSKHLLIELVTEKSAGKLQLKLSDIDFDIFSNEVKIHKAVIASTNKVNLPITYQVSFRKITLHTNSLWSLLIKRTVQIRQIKLFDPSIEVLDWHKDSTSAPGDNLSLGMELGKLYNSIEDAIVALNTHSIFIINAKLTLVNKTDTDSRPVIFSNIYFTLKKLNKRKSAQGSYLDSNSVIFNSSNQDITFTDGIHKLLFKKLVLQKGRNIILDSCTIIALPGFVSGNSYNIQFKRLALIGVDFDTLYKTNLIRADSVYCENPVSTINLNPAIRDKNAPAKGLPDLEKIIKEFSGNLDLGFVGVRNADIHVNITGKRGRSNINSGKGNFQIRNLRINPDSSKLITIKSFDMLIKGYLLYNADSSCNYSFDSVRFANDELLLNNFSLHTSSGIHTVRNYRDYSMPYFELLGLDWPELIFKQNLKATEAVLHDPTINFIKTAKPAVLKKSSIFNAHHTFDDFMEIQRLKIINGKINIKWGGDNFLQLQGLDLTLLPNDLKNYTDVKLQRNVESLFFPEGYIKIGDVNARLQNVLFNANDQIHAEDVFINNSRGGIDSKLNDVSIKNIYTEAGGNIVIDGLKWEQGAISGSSARHMETSAKPTSFLIKNISGKQTNLKFLSKGNEGHAFIEDVQIASLIKKNGQPITLNGFGMKGKEINLFNSSVRLSSENFLLSNNSQDFSMATLEHVSKSGTLNITMPHLRVTGNINSFFANDLQLDNVLMQSPVINFYKQNALPSTGEKASALPVIKINHISIREPVINVHLFQNLSSLDFLLPYSKGSEIKGGDIEIAPGGITIGTANIKTQKATILKRKKTFFDVGSGMDVALSKINISALRDTILWSGIVNKLKIENPAGFLFNLDKNRLELKDLTLGDCLLSSSTVSDINKFLSLNRTAWFSTSAVKYRSTNAIWQAFNTSYDAGKSLLSLDSFNYRPSMPRDSIIASSPYQIDYINFSSSNTIVSGFDIIKFFKEQKLAIQKVSMRRPSISIYRDKLPPYLSGIPKKLLAEKIMNISKPVTINQIEIDDGKLSYTEKNASTRLEGDLLLTQLNGSVSNIKNYDLQPADSLSIVFKGRLLGIPFFDLKIKESYARPLYGFTMRLNVEPARLVFLNPLLVPLSNIKFTSGKMDSFYMNVVGNENVAHGEMKFYYHGLHLQLLKNGELPKSASVKHVTSLLVNAFVVKTNNERRNGLIYFKRLKDRSFFNYMNKIIFSGVATSVGAKKNNQYRKDLIKDTQNPENP